MRENPWVSSWELSSRCVSEPALVTFCVDKSSSTWPALRSLGRFTANLLSTEQLSVCKALARKGEDKFRDIDYEESAIGTPRILNCTAWIDCQVLSPHSPTSK